MHIMHADAYVSKNAHLLLEWAGLLITCLYLQNVRQGQTPTPNGISSHPEQIMQEEVKNLLCMTVNLDVFFGPIVYPCI